MGRDILGVVQLLLFREAMLCPLAAGQPPTEQLKKTMLQIFHLSNYVHIHVNIFTVW